MPRNDNGTTWKLRMLINIMLAAAASLTVSIVSRISDARAFGVSAARRLGLLADKPARGARSGKQAIEHAQPAAAR